MTAHGERSLHELLRDAEVDLGTAAGGAAVCAFTKAGTPVPGIKYYEGRWAALDEVARRVRRSSETPTAVATEIRASWSADLCRLRARQGGADWIAYRDGGVDALADLLSIEPEPS